MNKPIDNLQRFLESLQKTEEIKKAIEKPQVTNEGVLVITVKRETYLDPEKFKTFLCAFNVIREECGFNNGVKMLGRNVIKANPPSFDVFALTFQVDLASLHKERLYQYFNPSIDKERLSESITFLLEHGWSEEKLRKEVNCSVASLYQYKAISA